MKLYKTIRTFNGDYDISVIGNSFSVQLESDEIIFDSEEKAIKAIHEHVFDCLFYDMPSLPDTSNGNLIKLIDVVKYLNDLNKRKLLYKYVLNHLYPSDIARHIHDWLDNIYDTGNSTDITHFVNIYKNLKESYLQIAYEEDRV